MCYGVPKMVRCGEKAGGAVWRGGGRTLEVGDRGFGVERVVTVVCGEFGAFQILWISQDYSNDVMSW